MTKKERLKRIKKEYQDRLNYLGDNDLIDGNIGFGLAYLIVTALDELEKADGRRKGYKNYEKSTIATLEKAFNECRMQFNNNKRRKENEKRYNI